MAGSTRKSSISLAPALTCDQSIGRRSRCRDAFNSREFRIPPGTVTGTAEVDRICWGKMSGVEDGRLCLSRRSRVLARHRLDVASARSVTGFTSHARNQVSLVETSADAGTCRMTTETPHHFRRGNGAFHSFFNVRGREQSPRWRKVDTSELLKVSHPGFKKICILLFEQIRLAHAARSKGPKQWKRHALIATTNRVLAPAPSG